MNFATYDLEDCLHANPQDGFCMDDVDRILAVIDGSNDEESWHWVLQLKNSQDYVYLTGDCDYSGWD